MEVSKIGTANNVSKAKIKFGQIFGDNCILKRTLIFGIFIYAFWFIMTMILERYKDIFLNCLIIALIFGGIYYIINRKYGCKSRTVNWIIAIVPLIYYSIFGAFLVAIATALIFYVVSFVITHFVK